MRRLDCTRCSQVVNVYEEPREFIDPALYVCGACLENVTAPLSLLDPERTEVHNYDPALAEIPY
jgi:hypothetical protein